MSGPLLAANAGKTLLEELILGWQVPFGNLDGVEREDF
jgi:hypothetical protein